MRKKYTILALGLIVVLGIASFVIVSRHKDSTNRLIKIKGYSYAEPGDVVCDSIAPECGTCLGKVINRDCYVTQAQFNDFKKIDSALEAE